MDFSTQINRIRQKLIHAKEKDPGLKVFGADHHQYVLGPPIRKQKVERFEEKYKVQLPNDYKAFITNLGNGGPGNYGGAGPGCGLYPLGDFGYMVFSVKYIANSPVIGSGLTKAKWKKLTAFDKELNEKETIEYELRYQSLFSGMMFIGTQGDSGQTMLILHGKDRGRVVYINQDLYPPVMADERNFIDWYEAWLDKISITRN